MIPLGSTIDPDPTMSTMCGAYETFFASLSIIGISPIPLTEMLTTLGMTLSMMSANESGSPARAATAPLSERAATRAGRRLRQDAIVPLQRFGRRGLETPPVILTAKCAQV